MMRNSLLAISAGAFLLLGCSSSDGGTSGSSSGGGTSGAPPQSVASCVVSSDCPAEHVCITVGDGSAGCVPICSASAEDCGTNASCGGVGMLSVDVCKETASDDGGGGDSTDSGASAEEQAQEEVESEVKIPCNTDADCSVVDPDAICAEWQGERDCTIVCSSEDECNPPALGGVTVDFLTCIADERSDKDRTACLPKAECFENPLNCISGLDNLTDPGNFNFGDDMTDFGDASDGADSADGSSDFGDDGSDFGDDSSDFGEDSSDFGDDSSDFGGADGFADGFSG